MDDLSSKLSALLNDPDGLNQIKELASSLLGEEIEAEEKEKPLQNSNEIAAIMQILNALKGANDKSVELLLALRPHLSYERQKRLDTAIKLLKIYSVLPLIKDSNLLGDLF